MRVVIIDDHPALLVGLRDVLVESGIDVVGEAGTVQDAIPLLERERPDVAIVDLRLPDGDGATICRSVRAKLPSTQCLIFSAGEEIASVADAVAAGATGFVYKGSDPALMVEAIKEVAGGRESFPRELYEQVIDLLQEAHGAVDALTPMDDSILTLLGEGESNREIGVRLGVAEKTVRNHVSALLRKLRLRDRTQAALYAQRRRGHRQS